MVLPDSTVSLRHAIIVRADKGWVIKDLESDNGICPIASVPSTETQVETGHQGSHLEFSEELCCCVGAVVLRLKAING